MSKVCSISLGCLPMVFKKCSFTKGETNTLLTIMLMMCRCNEQTYLEEIIAEFIRTEMNLDALHAQIFILEALPMLVEMGSNFRQLAQLGCLIRYEVYEHVVLLEIEDGY